MIHSSLLVLIDLWFLWLKHFCLPWIKSPQYTWFSNIDLTDLIVHFLLEIVSSEAATSQIAVDQNTDLNAIEAYAKQQLGMKKADSSQTVYIDTSESINKIQINKIQIYKLRKIG